MCWEVYSYKTNGVFTDNFTNYRYFISTIVSKIRNSKVLRLDATSEMPYSNYEKLSFKAYRENSEIEAIVGKVTIKETLKNFNP